MWLGGLLMCLLLSGCATGPGYQETTASMPPLATNSGRVFFLRDSIVGAAVQPQIWVGDQIVGRSQPGGFLYVDLPAGRHVARATTEVESLLEFDVKAGESCYISASIGIGLFVGRVSFAQIGEPEALTLLPKLKYSGIAPVTTAGAGGVQPRPSSPTTSPPSAAPSFPAVPPTSQRVNRATMDDLKDLLPKTP